ncbi:peptidoglycan-binding domain-containing protein [Sedimentitalea nanhaiensis]|uniref:peptidoglycan-binding domain-containing protein n=1 Tax=Sedimentitalea nanhaiensis TaxID=999627 RepID=UPI0004250DCA|nr:peptidoglycan-binding domain-containing protein [Sedimentitalea nanhaiensis]
MLLKDDGIFGPRTEDTVREFQTAHGLDRDGVVGPMTWKKILGNDQIEHFDE